MARNGSTSERDERGRFVSDAKCEAPKASDFATGYGGLSPPTLFEEDQHLCRRRPTASYQFTRRASALDVPNLPTHVGA